MNFLENQKKKLFDDIFNNWNVFSKQAKSLDYRNNVVIFLNKLKKIINEPATIIDIEARKFIGAITMIKFDMFDKNVTKDIELYYITKELLDIFDNIDSSTIKLFFTKFDEYLIKFDKWKEKDEKELIDKSCTQDYKQIQVIQSQYTGNTPDEVQLSKSASMLKKKFEHRIKAIGGQRGMKYVNDSPKLNPLDVMTLDMEENMKKAFWDMFENDVNNNKLEPIATNLEEFKKYLFQLLGNSTKAKEIKNQFDKQLDLDITKQMIINNSMTGPEIYNIINILIHYVKTYVHSPSEDSDTEIFLNNIKKKMEEQKETLGSILRYFFQNIFMKMDKTKVQIELLKL